MSSNSSLTTVVCRFPFVPPDCKQTIAQKVYFTYYLPMQVILFTVGAILSIVCVTVFVNHGRKIAWDWKNFQLKLLGIGAFSACAGMVQCIDPLGWNAIIPGNFDMGFTCLFCSVSFTVLSQMCSSMAKVTAGFASTFGEDQVEKIAKLASGLILVIQVEKYVVDVLLFTLVLVDLNNTWIYKTAHAVNGQANLIICYVILTYFGHYILREQKKALGQMTGAVALGETFRSKKAEYDRFVWMIQRLQFGLIAYSTVLWFPTSWWIYHKANFTTNPPGVPPSFLDFFLRTFHVWMTYASGVNQAVFQNVRFVESYCHFVNGASSLWEELSICFRMKNRVLLLSNSKSDCGSSRTNPLMTHTLERTMTTLESSGSPQSS